MSSHQKPPTHLIAKNGAHKASPHSEGQQNGSHPLTKIFRRFAQKTAKIVGSPWSFVLACMFVVLWFLSGPFVLYSPSWQLVINTATTIVTFLMVFLLQNTQNRDTKALHLKLDELIYIHKLARNHLLDAEELLDDEEMEMENKEFREKRQRSLGNSGNTF